MQNILVPFRTNRNWQMIFLLALSFVIYGNTITHDYALDDILVINDNDFVKKGFAGIPDILTTDYFFGYEKIKNDLTGGRYRPFSLVVFAVEYAIFKENPLVSHLINVLLNFWLIWLVFDILFRHLIPGKFKESMLGAIIFCVHPTHTEVVANIKSRDEIIAFILLLISWRFYFKYEKEIKNYKALMVSLSCFFLALLTKESSLTFLAIIPAGFYFLKQADVRKCIRLSLPYLGVTGLFFIIRYMVVGFKVATTTEILNAPYINASFSEALATKILVLGKYFLMLFWPYPMSYDYSFNAIPYYNFSDPQVLVSLILYIALAVLFVVFLKNRNIFGFAILIFLATISIVSNLLIDIGAPMADRLLFQPSFALALFLPVFLYQRKGFYRIFLMLGVYLLLLFFSGYSIVRNLDWKNNDTLFLKDVETVPESSKTNLNAAVSKLRIGKEEESRSDKLKLYGEGVKYGKRALKIYPEYTDAHLNIGVIYYHIFKETGGNVELFKAANHWNKVRTLSPAHPKGKEFADGIAAEFLSSGYKAYKNSRVDSAMMYFNTGKQLTSEKNVYLSNMYYRIGYAQYEFNLIDSAIFNFNRGLEYNPKNIEILYNLGGNYLIKMDTLNAVKSWQKTVEIKPDHALAKQWLQSLKK